MGLLTSTVALSTLALTTAFISVPRGKAARQVETFEYFPDPRYPDEMVNPSTMTDKCMSEGFFPHPYDCTWFYRCHDRIGRGFFSKTSFICAPGTEFDDDLDVCITKSGTCGAQLPPGPCQEGHHLDPSTGICHPCLKDIHCPADRYCTRNNRCEECLIDIHCPDDRSCTRNNRCENPCLNYCDSSSNATCKVTNHQPLCYCPDGYYLDPSTGRQCIARCDSDWKYLKGECFYISPNRLNWANATQNCKNSSSSLYEPSNSNTLQVQDLATLVDTSITLDYWVGACKKVNSFIWWNNGDLVDQDNPVLKPKKGAKECISFSVIGNPKLDTQKNRKALKEVKIRNSDKNTYLKVELDWDLRSFICQKKSAGIEEIEYGQPPPPGAIGGVAAIIEESWPVSSIIVPPRPTGTTGFLCENGKVISQFWKCDYQDDCGDNSDERNCFYVDGFQCDNGNVISQLWKCDGDNDCLDNSDERGCSYDDKFQCENENVISKFWKCDGEDDCGDNSDETGCSYDDSFQCENGNLIPISLKCDGGEPDCDDGSDEKNCRAFTCMSGKYQCGTGQCIDSLSRCDGANDCLDNSDESFCPTDTPCSTNGFQCTNGTCINASWKCDGTNDCGDNYDEINCPLEQCTGFQCGNGQCIFSSWECDGANDCDDNSDERNCNKL